MRRIILATVLAGFLTTGCAALNPQTMTFEQLKQLSEMANVSGCAGGWVAGVGVGSLRLALQWGQPTDEALKYCVRE